MNTLAHVLEGAGLATVALALILPVTQKMRPPRALYCEFPFGRPLGKPRDPTFQHEVLAAAFALLERPTGPMLETFPEVVSDEVDAPLSCPLPPRFDDGARPCVSEAKGLRPAYDRAVRTAGRTQVGRVVTADGVPAMVDRLARLADGEPWAEAGFADEWQLAHGAMDVRAYYEEAAIGLADHVPAARAAESWLFQKTAAGDVLRSLATRLVNESDPSLPPWLPYVLVPRSQQQDDDSENVQRVVSDYLRSE